MRKNLPSDLTSTRRSRSPQPHGSAWFPCLLIGFYLLVMAIIFQQEREFLVSSYYRQMEDIIQQHKQSLNAFLNAPFPLLRACAENFLQGEDHTPDTEDIRSHLQLLREAPLEEILFLKNDANLLSPDEGWLDGSAFASRLLSLQKQEQVFRTRYPQGNTGADVLVFSVPVVVKKDVKGCLLGLISITKMESSILPANVSDKYVSSYLLDANEKIILSTRNSPFSVKDKNFERPASHNIIDTWYSAPSFDDHDGTLHKLKLELNNQLYFGLSSKIPFNKLMGDEWTIVELQPHNRMLYDLSRSGQKYILLSILFLVAIISSYVLMRLNHRQKNRLKAEREKAVEREQQLNAILQFSGISLIVFNLKENSATIQYFKTPESDTNSDVTPICKTITSVPGCIRQNKLIFNEDIDSFETFYRNLGSQKQSRWIGRCLYAKNSYRYSQLICKRFADGGSLRAVGTLTDIHSHMLDVEKLRHMSQTDQLTGLYKRNSLKDFFEREIHGKHPEGWRMAVFFLDIDDFKSINDSYGHSKGDAVLQTTAQCLKSQFRSSDCIARFGGDEFAVGMSMQPNTELSIDNKAKLLCQVFSELQKAQNGIPVTCSIGIALYPDHALTFEEIYNAADVALYASKEQGKNNWCLFDPDRFCIPGLSPGKNAHLVQSQVLDQNKFTTAEHSLKLSDNG